MSAQTVDSQPVPFGVNQTSNAERIAGAPPVCINVTMDATGTIRRRPGLQDSSLAITAVVDAAGIEGMHYTLGGKLFVTNASATAASTVYDVTAASAANLGTFDRDSAPQFAETEAMLVIAGGRRVQRVLFNPQGLAVLVEAPATDAPLATSIVANNSRLVASNPAINGQAYYSAPAQGSATIGHEQWSVGVTSFGRSGFFNAEARPDPLVVIAENINELFLFGQTSLQVFAPDQSFIYAPVTTVEYGCGAAGSVIRDEQSFAWLDDSRRIVYSDGRTVEVLSDAIKTTLDNLSTISDCVGYRVLQGPVDALVWSFPTDGITLAYQKGGGWAQWSSWDDTTNNWAPMVVSATAYVPGTGTTLVGTSTGRVGEFSRAASTDFGTRIPASVTSGFVSHGTDRMKRCIALRLALRRGESGRTDEPLASLEWRDGLSGWSDPIEVSLGATGDDEIVVDLRALGVYRRREWRFSFHGTEDIVLASAVEEFEVLDL